MLGRNPSAGRRLGSLVLGYYDPQGRLRYAGAVGTDFSERELRDLRRRLGALASAAPAELLVAGDDLDRSIHWVQPELIAQIHFTAWKGRIRH